MITKRLAILVGMVALGFLAIFLLPKSSAQPTGLQLTDGNPVLPASVGGWSGTDMPITPVEITTLGEGTQFARKRYTHPRERGLWLESTIVLSGRDIATSLHRPERCLDGQGWQILSSESFPLTVERQGAFDVRRLHVQKSVKTADGQWHPVEAYFYYWLIGEHTITANHFERFLADNRDRFFRGVDQRWAYISILLPIPQAVDPKNQDKVREAKDQDVQAFIQALAPSVHAASVNYH
jgi:hypothetical protein